MIFLTARGPFRQIRSARARAVDRISANAKANKAQLYAYFGDKDRLFDTVFAEHADEIVNAVPMTAHDLPAYAIGLYDACLTKPNLVRQATWARLERVPAGELVTTMPEETTQKPTTSAAAKHSPRRSAVLSAHRT